MLQIYLSSIRSDYEYKCCYTMMQYHTPYIVMSHNTSYITIFIKCQIHHISKSSTSYHVGLMITITSSTIFSTTNLLPPSLSSTSFLSQQSVAYAVGPTQVPLTITSYKAVELCDGRKPIMPGQKAMEGLIMIYMI